MPTVITSPFTRTHSCDFAYFKSAGTFELIKFLGGRFAQRARIVQGVLCDERAGLGSYFVFGVSKRRYIVPAMIHDASLDELLQKVWNGGRINEAEARRLYALPLEELGALADRRRQLLRAHAHGGRGNEIVSYIV